MKTLTLLLFGFVAACQTPDDEVAVHAALRDNRELVQHILTSTGQDKNEELAPGRAVDIYLVRLDELAAFDGNRPLLLLHRTEERFFPLHGRAGAARASMTLQKSATGWTMTRAGASNLTASLVANRSALPTGAEEHGLVRIHGLQTDFLSATVAGQLYLTPLFDDQSLGMRKGVAQPATLLLSQLVPAARKVLATSPRRVGEAVRTPRLRF